MKKSIFFESISSNLQSEFDSEKIFQMISSSSQIILLILIFIWMLRRISFLKDQNKTNFIKIVDKLPIGPKESIIIIEIQNEKLVLGVTSNNITHLHTLSSFYKNDKKEDKVDRNTFLKTNFFYYYLEKFSKISWKKTMLYRIILILFFLLFCSSAQAEIPAFTSHVLEDGGQTWSVPIQTLVFLTSLAFLPAFLLMMTSFTRIIIVFGFLRNALGTPYAPPNQILIGLALFLTFFIMSPIFDKVYQEAYVPLSQKKITMEEAIEKGSIPLKQFMLNQTRIPDLELFSKLAHISEYKNKNEIPMRIVLPSFVTSELKTAFQIGFTIFIPFLIIDLIVASVLMALGMIMVPPSTISLPFKLMLFVLSDGWRLLISSLTQSFNL